MQYDLAIYDWNGTLAADVEIAHDCVTLIFRTFAPQLRVPNIEAWRQDNSNVDFLEFYYRNGIPREVTITEMRNIWGPHYDALAGSRPLRLAPAVKKVLELCAEHQVPNIIVSSSIDDVHKHLKRSRVGHLFHTVHVEVHDKKAKLEEIVNQFKIAPHRAFYVNDTYDGLVHAREAGLTAIGFTDGFNCENRVREANPHYVISSFSQLFEILQR